MTTQAETPYASLLTPAGSGAIAVIGVRGPGGPNLLATYFAPRRSGDLRAVPVGRVLLGDWRRDDGTSEELLIARVSDEEWEIQCHGGVAAVETILADLARRHVDVIPWTDWLRLRTRDPLQCAAQQELARAVTLRTAAILLDQVRGAFRDAVRDIVSKLEHVISRRTRNGISAPEREWADREIELEPERMLAALLDRWPVGSHLTRPWRVVLVGPPNVGKSSLLNRILGYDRAIVFDQPGTTRDIVTAQTALDGWPVELSDTAGMRETTDTLEQAGVALAEKTARQADLVVLLAAWGPWVFEDQPIPTRAVQGRSPSLAVAAEPFELPPHISHVKVVSKWDLRAALAPSPHGWIGVSSETGEGLDELLDAIVDRLIPRPPRPGDAVPFLPHHQIRLAASLEALREGDWEEARRELEMLLEVHVEA